MYKVLSAESCSGGDSSQQQQQQQQQPANQKTSIKKPCALLQQAFCTQQ
jgi:hypothetical protein